MTVRKINKGITEAERFIKAANQAISRISEEYPHQSSPDFAPVCGLRETAACRRASLDLTRALADLRK